MARTVNKYASKAGEENYRPGTHPKGRPKFTEADILKRTANKWHNKICNKDYGTGTHKSKTRAHQLTICAICCASSSHRCLYTANRCSTLIFSSLCQSQTQKANSGREWELRSNDKYKAKGSDEGGNDKITAHSKKPVCSD